MKKRDEILSILRDLKPYLHEKYAVEQLGLFGSVARGSELTPKSDIDVLVTLSQPLGLGFMTLADEIEAALGSKTDVVSKKGIRPLLWSFIEEDLIYV